MVSSRQGDDQSDFDDDELEAQAKRPTYASTQGQVGEREGREAAVAGPLKAAKKRVVSKKELEASGKSLRDFLNEKQGLTRRKPKTVDYGVSKPEGMTATGMGMKKGGTVKSKAKAKSGCARGDGIATKGKTKGRMV